MEAYKIYVHLEADIRKSYFLYVFSNWYELWQKRNMNWGFEFDSAHSSIMLGTGFTGVADIETGQDGFLYILTHDRETGDGNLYWITSSITL